eukprot:CAMPEP_0204364088 /NCGR_PEP_ID=MMETSP0469-20131031/40865_1 /ASSEMBLY_ACC=CAM_ASM_000384 /TAXON_ID=2969 /ORGANISM="Oxyrrhis marina" /LENGTH=209 /DNA_ID=CAMNT_0051352923 /DNA_START=45 /DNA_END=671 /DNA_ORIENTATION=-
MMQRVVTSGSPRQKRRRLNESQKPILTTSKRSASSRSLEFSQASSSTPVKMEQNRKILSLRTPVQGHHHPRFQQLLAKPIKEGVEWIVPVAGDKSPPAPEDDLAMAVHRRSERALSSPPPPRAYRTSSAGSSVPMDRRGRSGPLQRMSSRGSDRSSMSRSSTVLSLPEEPWSSEPKSSRGRASDGSVQSGRRRPPAQGEVLVPMLAEEG